jgi:iduronate 2-sulfatase
MIFRPALFLCLALFASGLPAAAPNVLFIMADDYRPEMSGLGSVAITPHLDRLAKRSLTFQRAYCQQAVCNPSRSSMLTGLRPDTTRIWNNSTHFRDLNPDAPTIPGWFKQHGYATHCVGKIFHNWHTKVKGDRASWSADEFLHYANHGNDLPEVKGDLPANQTTLTPLRYGETSMCECRAVPDEAYYDGRVAAEAVKTMAALGDKPFFLAVGFWKPHAPFNAPKKYWDMYDRKNLPALNANKPSGAPELAFHKSTEILGRGGKDSQLTAEQMAEMRHGYFANISYLDAQLGKVLDALEKHPNGANTVITFVGDHGYHIGEHSLWGKTSNFEYDAHVPFLVAAPNMIAAGQKTQALAELVDLFPTLTSICGLPTPRGLDGSDLSPVLKDAAREVDAAAFTQHPRPAYYDREPSGRPSHMGYSVRTHEVRYTEWRDWESGEVTARELYAHPSDEAELTNAIDDPKLQEAQKRAETLLQKQFPQQSHP